MSWLSTAVRWVETSLEGLTDKIPPAIKNDLGVFFDTFASQAKDEVIKLMPDVLSGKIKPVDALLLAAGAIKDIAIADGWQVLDTAPITLVQTIVTGLKMNQKGALVVPPPGIGSTPPAADKK